MPPLAALAFCKRLRFRFHRENSSTEGWYSRLALKVQSSYFLVVQLAVQVAVKLAVQPVQHECEQRAVEQAVKLAVRCLDSQRENPVEYVVGLIYKLQRTTQSHGPLYQEAEMSADLVWCC